MDIQICFNRGREAAGSGLYSSAEDGLLHWNNLGIGVSERKRCSIAYIRGYNSYVKVDRFGEISDSDFNKDSQNVRLMYRVGKNWVYRYFVDLANAIKSGQELVRRGNKFHIDCMSRDYYAHSSIGYESGKNRRGGYKVLGCVLHNKI